MPDQPSPLQPGLLILHGNRLEWLAQAVCDWLGRHPLAPLETETVLVQSNGMGEWLKMQLAAAHGVCAATSVELPARFLWRAYRAVLGAQAVPSTSPLDEQPLTWRLMGLLPTLSRQPGFEPLRAFLGSDDTDAARRLQLAQRLADLFDQYQVHRSDWLRDWAEGRDVLRTGLGGSGPAEPVPEAQRWQPALWRHLLAVLGRQAVDESRAQVHGRFLQAMQQARSGSHLHEDLQEDLHEDLHQDLNAEPAWPSNLGATTSTDDATHPQRRFPALPRRVVLFGTTHIPLQTLEAIAALAEHCQVLMAVPNPCRYHWADTIDGRELLRMQRRRHALRQGLDLSAVPPELMHVHGHPLLSAWGRQSRDFIRQLDAFDDAEAARQRFAIPRIDLFDETPPRSLLQQVHAAVRDLLPLVEHPRGRSAAIESTDRSIAFHVAHSPQREVEVLHDQLLHLLAHPPDGEPLAPRDIVVMVPDIDTFAPAIRSVFGQPTRGDARFIPWGIADQRDRGQHPLLLALEWLMRAPQQRFGASEVRALLDVPAAAARLELDADALPLLHRWIEDAGVRWGLDDHHRASLGLTLAMDQGALANTWAFGLRRMLLGYATGEVSSAEPYADIEPYAEVAGLDAALAGTLDHLLQTLQTWWADARQPRTPTDWAARLRQLLAELFQASDANERALLRALDTGLEPWLQACDAAGFDEAVDLAVAREAWLGTVDEPGLNRRFRAGGVTFCTLLPMRAIPFDVVCLLGMNDGDYPRRTSRADFDLMALPGQARPGDRSRRDDDRQLMLDAVLSARRVLHVSWCGHSPRDAGEQPPSVLVAQLRDYLRQGWGDAAVDERTVHHPLQPFSRRYFDPTDPLFTYASEWRDAHAAAQAVAAAAEAARTPPIRMDEGARLAHAMGSPLTVQALADFVRNPVKTFFSRRLQVRFDSLEARIEDDEPFTREGIARWALIDEVLDACRRELGARSTADTVASSPFVAQHIARLQRAGRLPLAGPGRRVRDDLQRTVTAMVERWRMLSAEHPLELPPQSLRWVHPQDPGLVFDDVLTGLRAAPGGPPVWIELVASRVAEMPVRKNGVVPRPDQVAAAWLRCLASAACGHPAEAIVVGQGTLVHLRPPPMDEAQDTLQDLLAAWAEGMRGSRPWPTAMKTGLAVVAGAWDKARELYDGGGFGGAPGEVRDPCLARLHPDFDSLRAAEGFEAACHRLYAPWRDGLTRHATAQAWDPDEDSQEAGDA